MSKYILQNKFKNLITIEQDDSADPASRLPIRIKADNKGIRVAAKVDIHASPSPFGKPIGATPTPAELSFVVKYLTVQKDYVLVQKQEPKNMSLAGGEDDLL